jgi:hypothetical protein
VGVFREYVTRELQDEKNVQLCLNQNLNSGLLKYRFAALLSKMILALPHFLP